MHRPFIRAALICVTLLTFAACDDDDGAEQRLQSEIAELNSTIASLNTLIEGARQSQAANGQVIEQYTMLLENARNALAMAEQNLIARTGDLNGVALELAALRGQLEGLDLVLSQIAGSVDLHLPFVYEDAPVVLGEQYPLGDDAVSFSEIRYWLSNLSFLREDGAEVQIPNSYYLIEARPAQTYTVAYSNATYNLPANRRETVELIRVPAGVYTGVRFHVGVDQAHNDDLSIGGGELHVLNGMAFDDGWMWLTSYIFSKTRGTFIPEGSSSSSFRWDTGTNDDYRQVDITFGETPIVVNAIRSHRIVIPADVETLVTAVAPGTNPNIGGHDDALRAMLADAYQGMFSFESAEVSLAGTSD